MTDETPAPDLRQRIETALGSLNRDGGALADLDDDNDVSLLVDALLPLFAAERAAAYRAAADELRVVADNALMWQAGSSYAAAANLLRARADTMEQQ